jgi:predicted permease
MFRRRRPSADFDDEIAAHLQLEVDRLVERGLTPDEARAAAHRAFGNVTAARERFHESGRWLFWDRLVQDVRFAFRLFARTPVLTVAVVSTLALGIGAASAIFSLVNAVVLRPLPYVESDRLVQLFETGPRLAGEADWVSFPNFRDWRRDSTVFDDVAAYRYALLTVTGSGDPESLLGLEATDRLFAVLGVSPALGRTFHAGEDASARRHVAVIGHALWRRRFAADPAVIGRGVTINSEPYTIVGVMPEWFRFPNAIPGDRVVPIEVWIPMRPDDDLEERGSHNFWSVARLKSGVTLQQARAAMTTLAANLARQYPDTNKDMRISVVPLQDYVAGGARRALLLLLGAVGLVLLLTCANIGGLLLSRAEARRHEMGMRHALGASRARLARQALTESLLLASLGAAAGLLLAHVGTGLLVAVAPATIPRLDETRVDGAVLTFTAVVAVCAGILFGLAPVLFTSVRGVHESLKATGTRVSAGVAGRRVRQTLAAAQLAIAVMLLIGAGLLVRSFARVAGLDLGFETPRLLTAVVSLSPVRYDSPARQTAFFEEAIRRIDALPGVVGVALSNTVPLTGINDQGAVTVEGISPAPGEDGPVGNRPRVSAGYFDVMGIRLLEGRTFDERDRRDSAPVAIVSDLAARMYWPQGALGKRLATEWQDGKPVWREIVGVVQSTRHFGPEAPQKPEFYRPYQQRPSPFMQLVVRTEPDAEALLPAVRKTIVALDPEQPVLLVSTMEELVATSGARRRFQALLVAAFAALALLLATIGVYAVMSHMVAQRRREIGVRLALGARAREVTALILRNGLRLTVIGAVTGLGGSVALSRVLRQALYGVSTLDPVTYGAVSAALVLVAGFATYLPSRSAARVDPLLVLREE